MNPESRHVGSGTQVHAAQPRPRVLLVTNIWAPYKEPLLAELARLVDLHVLYSAATESNRKWKMPATQPYSYRVLGGTTLRLGSRELHWNRTIFKELADAAPDVVIIGGYSFPTAIAAILWCRRNGVASILWSGSTSVDAGRTFTILKRWLVSGHSAYVAYTTRAREYLTTLGAKRDRIVIAPITVDTAMFGRVVERSPQERMAVRQRMQVPVDAPVLLYVGQLIHRKGVDLLMTALGGLQHIPWRLVVAGSGSDEARFKRQAVELRIADRIHWLGHVSQQGLADAYSIAHAMVLPSRIEPSGNVINEAMAAGVPVIMSDAVGADVLIAGENGWVFRSGDASDLRAQLAECLTDADRRNAYSRESVSRMEHFGIEAEAARFKDAVDLAYSSIVRGELL